MSTPRRAAACAILACTLAAAWYMHRTAADAGPTGHVTGVSTGTIVQFPPASRPAAPPLTGRLLDGNEFRLANWRGSVVVVNFWASWCAPCGDEAPDLQAVAVATANLGVHLLGVNVNDERDEAKAFVGFYHLTYPTLFDATGTIPLTFPAISPRTIPNTVVLDRAGKVAAVSRRKITRTDLEATVRALVAEPTTVS